MVWSGEESAPRHSEAEPPTLAHVEKERRRSARMYGLEVISRQPELPLPLSPFFAPRRGR
jgi:hypothetical protein